MTTSEISVTLTNKENNVIYQCHGTNDALGEMVVDTVTLTVMGKYCGWTRSPSPPCVSTEGGHGNPHRHV